MSKWKPYPKIKRLGTIETKHLLECNDIFIEPKIDGSNASISYEDGEIKCAKRSGPLTPDDRGFRGFDFKKAQHECNVAVKKELGV